MASKLAKYMDNRSLLVEGSLSGRVGTFDCPVTLKIFGTGEPVERAYLRQQMKSDGLSCQMIDQNEKEAKKRKREELKNIAAAKKANKRGMGGVLTGGQQWDCGQGDWSGTMSQGDGLSSTQSIDDIMETAQKFNPRDMSKHLFTFLLL